MRFRILLTLLVLAELMALWKFVSHPPLVSPLPEPVQEVPPRPPDYGKGCKHFPPKGLRRAVDGATVRYSLPDPWMLVATVHRESGCDQYALGAAGEIGLAQVNPSVWMKTLKEEGIAQRPQELWDVGANLRAAAYILGRIMDVTPQREGVTGVFRRYNGSGARALVYAKEQGIYYRKLLSRPKKEPYSLL